MATPVPMIQSPTAPVAYHLIAQLVPVFDAPTMVTNREIPTPPPPMPNMSLTLIPLASSPQSPIVLVPAIVINQEGPTNTQSDTLLTQPGAVIHIDSQTAACTITTTPQMVHSDTDTIRALAANCPHWSYLTAVQPISPPSSPTTHALPETMPLHSPQGADALGNEMANQVPTAGNAPASQPAASDVNAQKISTPIPFPDIDPWILLDAISSRPPSPLFDELPVLYDTHGILDAIKSLDEPMEADGNNNESFLNDLYQDLDLSALP